LAGRQLRAAARPGHDDPLPYSALGCSTKESSPLKISSLMMKIIAKMKSAAIGAMVTHTSQFRPSFWRAAIQRRTGGSRRVSRKRLAAEYW
jgi:hypothetical protein